jgi:hypothetical protein
LAKQNFNNIIDDSLGGFAGGLESDGEIHKPFESTGRNIFGDSSGDP